MRQLKLLFVGVFFFLYFGQALAVITINTNDIELDDLSKCGAFYSLNRIDAFNAGSWSPAQ